VLKALQLLGRGHLPRVETLLVPLGALPDLVDVGLGLDLLPADVGVLGLGGDQQVADLVTADGQFRDRGGLGQGPAAVRQLIDAGVQRLQVEQPPLVRECDVQRSSSWCGPPPYPGSALHQQIWVAPTPVERKRTARRLPTEETSWHSKISRRARA
jgi:hypothetical protein